MPGGFDAQQQIRLDGALGWKEKNTTKARKTARALIRKTLKPPGGQASQK
jgi:hypothetical protein